MVAKDNLTDVNSMKIISMSIVASVYNSENLSKRGQTPIWCYWRQVSNCNTLLKSPCRLNAALFSLDKNMFLANAN